MPKIGGSERGDGVQAVLLALQILDFIARQGSSVGVTALSQALGTSKSRIFRHLRTLVEQQYLIQALDSENYLIGSRLTTLSRLVGQGGDLVAAAREAMRDLRDALGHCVVVSQFESDGVCVTETLPGNSTIEIGVKRGSILAFHSSAQGKVALAFADDVTRARVYRGPMASATPHTTTTPEALARQVKRIQGQGWAVSPNEEMLGINALAAPIFNSSGLIAGTLAIVDSVQFIAAKPSAAQIDQVTATANRISTALGYTKKRVIRPRRRSRSSDIMLVDGSGHAPQFPRPAHGSLAHQAVIRDQNKSGRP